jgi:hypothetical protein
MTPTFGGGRRALLVKLAPWIDELDENVPRKGRGYRPSMSAQELRDSARAKWVLDPARAQDYDFILAVHDQVVVGIWSIDPGSWRPYPPLNPGGPGRWGCDIREAPPDAVEAFTAVPLPTHKPDGRRLFGSGSVVAYWPA